MLSYEIDPARLSSLVPAGTEIDSWNGRTFISLVGFRFLRTRVFGVPIPFHRRFEELNLRFYVRRKAPDGVRRGVVFIKELAPRAAVAWVARRFYNESYVTVPMRHEVSLPSDHEGGGAVCYEWRWNGRWNHLRMEVSGSSRIPDLDSEEAFITEHYWGYSRQRDGSTLEYEVEHPRWRVWDGAHVELDCDGADLYGPDLAKVLAGSPSSAFVADGSGVVVRRGVAIASDIDPAEAMGHR